MRRIIFLLGILLATIGVSAQQTVTVQAQSYQVSDNLDLEAVAITFGESKNVEDFEHRLNDPENRISNLDLNNDGYVDFLRVVEVEENGTHLVLIQAVIGQDLYQDVASVIVEGKNKTSATVTIVGNRDIYGNNYVLVPSYVVRPVIFDWFWLPTYVVYRSTWYWNHYPHYYHHYTCLGYHSYHRHIHVWHNNHHNHCDFHRPTDYHHHTHHVELHRTISRNDYVTHRPNQGYRAEPTPNRHVEARPITSGGRPAGSLSTSTNNRVEKPATRVQPTTSATTTRTQPTTSSTAVRSQSTTSTPTMRRPTTSTTSKSTTLPARPTTTTTRKTTNTTTSTNKTTTVAPRTTTTSTRSTSVSPITSNSRSTTSSLRSTTSTSRATSVKSTTSTSNRTTSSTARKTTTTTVKTNKNTSTTRR